MSFTSVKNKLLSKLAGFKSPPASQPDSSPTAEAAPTKKKGKGGGYKKVKT